MRHKMVREMVKWQEIDEAFKKIKTSTGVDDPQLMVEKFEKKDVTYFKLLETVALSEAKIDKLKVENEDLRTQIHDMKISSEKGSGESELIKNLQSEQNRLEKETAIKKEKYYNVEIIMDIITQWAQRVATKVDESISPERAKDTDIVNLFNNISDRVCELLTQLQDEPVQKANMMNDFLTDDFVNKNIRVRPNSGKTFDEDREMKSHNSKAHLKRDQDEINEEMLLNTEFQDTREDVKRRQQVRIEEEVARLKKLEKEAQKK